MSEKPKISPRIDIKTVNKFKAKFPTLKNKELRALLRKSGGDKTAAFKAIQAKLKEQATKPKVETKPALKPKPEPAPDLNKGDK